MSDLQEIIDFVKQCAQEEQLVSYPFKVGNYNRDVVVNYPKGQGEKMKLPYGDDIISFIFMFDNLVMCYDEAVKKLAQVTAKINQKYPQRPTRQINANDMIPGTYLPYVHVQTAGNTAGGAFYYQKKQVDPQPPYWEGQSVFGVSVQPDFRLGTVMAGTLVFENLEGPTLIPQPPYDVYKTQKEKIIILNSVNGICPPKHEFINHCIEE